MTEDEITTKLRAIEAKAREPIDKIIQRCPVLGPDRPWLIKIWANGYLHGEHDAKIS